MIKTNNVEKAKAILKGLKESPSVILAQDDNFNRKILEYGKFDVLLSAEQGERKDKLKQMDSGFNHFLGLIAAKKGVALGIDIEDLRLREKKEKAILISRMMQNIKICRKTDADIRAMGFRDAKNAFSFLISAGASSKQAKKAISF